MGLEQLLMGHQWSLTQVQQLLVTVQQLVDGRAGDVMEMKNFDRCHRPLNAIQLEDCRRLSRLDIQ